MPPSDSRGLAFYDFDGTLVSGDVVRQYIWYIWEARSIGRIVRLYRERDLLRQAEARSRAEFNQVFYAHYKGLHRSWLAATAERVWTDRLRRKTIGTTATRVRADIAAGFRPILITGSLDFAMKPVARDLGFECVVANQLDYDSSGIATGRLAGRLIASEEKARVVEDLCREYAVSLMDCRAYADDLSDAPMLRAVGHPVAVCPKPELRALAVANRWEIIER